MREAGRAVPGSVSVVGFDDIPQAGFLTPALTTVRLDFTELGRASFALLREQMGAVPVDRPRPVQNSSSARVRGHRLLASPRPDRRPVRLARTDIPATPTAGSPSRLSGAAETSQPLSLAYATDPAARLSDTPPTLIGHVVRSWTVKSHGMVPPLRRRTPT